MKKEEKDKHVKISADSKKQRDLQNQYQNPKKHREETETIIDKLQDKTQLIDYAKEYEHYTGADYEKDIEIEVEKYLIEEYEVLSEDAMYHNSDIDGTSINDELIESKLKEQENEIRNMVNKRVQERKNLVKKLPNLYKEQQSLIQELQGKMQSLNKEEPVYQDTKQLLGQLEQTNELLNIDP